MAAYSAAIMIFSSIGGPFFGNFLPEVPGRETSCFAASGARIEAVGKVHCWNQMSVAPAARLRVQSSGARPAQ